MAASSAGKWAASLAGKWAGESLAASSAGKSALDIPGQPTWKSSFVETCSERLPHAQVGMKKDAAAVAEA